VSEIDGRYLAVMNSTVLPLTFAKKEAIIDRLYTCVYSRHYYAASDFEMFTLWTQLVSAESAASQKLPQVQITVLESTEAEASKEVIWNVGLRPVC